MKNIKNGIQVRSRDGKELRPFDLSRIMGAVQKAMDATGTACTQAVLEVISVRAYANAQDKISGGILDVEDIQNAVQDALVESGFKKVKDAYQAYRSDRDNVRSVRESLAKSIVYDYTEGADALVVNNNASSRYSFGGLILSIAGAVSKRFWRAEVWDKAVTEAAEKNSIKIHDEDYLSAYCAGWSLKQLIQEGIVSVDCGKNASSPAKHLDSLCGQMVNFLGIMQNEWAGAQAFSSFDTYLAPFLRADCADDYEYQHRLRDGDIDGANARRYTIAKRAIERFVFGVNTPSRWGSQAPFSNITLDWVCPADMAAEPAIVGGKEQSFTYGDCQEEMDVINKAFLNLMIQGDGNGGSFSYPIPTYNIVPEFNWSDTENNRLLFEMTSKFGTPYFSNYINSDMKPSDVRSMCCRLRLDLRELRNQNGGNFGAGEMTGSIGVVTINLPQIGYLSESRENFFVRLREQMDLAARCLDERRKAVQDFMNKGLYPYSRYYLRSNGEGSEFKNHFSTIGIVGMNEACLNIRWDFLGDLTSEKARAFALEVLDFMRERLSDYQEQFGTLFNLEATPAESTCYKLAREDRKMFPDIITAGTKEAPYYTNSTHLPVSRVSDIFEALDMEDEMQTKYTSGTVFHAFLGEKLPDWKVTAKLVKTIAENYRLPYFTISPTYSICREHGYIAGEVYECPHCGKQTEVYSRITGYYRPVQNWNSGKEQEFHERAVYDISSLGSRAQAEKPAESVIEPLPMGNGEITLFTTSTCGKCRLIKQLLQAKDVPFKEVLCDEEAGKSLARVYDIKSVPVLAVTSQGGIGLLRDFSEIRNYIETL